MRPDGLAGPGRYRCGCGAVIGLTGLPKLGNRNCSLRRGRRICNGPKLPDAIVCEPCSVTIATLALADPQMATQLGAKRGATEYALARKAEKDRLLAEFVDFVRPDRRPEVPKICLVYYCELRPGLVKIGTTTQLSARMSALRIPPAGVLAAEPGHYQLEKLRHQQFASQRVARTGTGNRREDFRLDETLSAHIAKVADLNGDAFQLEARLAHELEELAQDPPQS
jgi:T5orf172 domain